MSHTCVWWLLHSSMIQEATHRNQSTAMMRVMSSVGSPTEVSTITMVTRPAWGMPAAPILAAVAVILDWGETWRQMKQCLLIGKSICLSFYSPLLLSPTWWWWSDQSSSPCCWPGQWRWPPALHTELFRPCWWWHPQAAQNEWFAYQFCCSPPDIWRWQGVWLSWEMKEQKQLKNKSPGEKDERVRVLQSGLKSV